MILSKKNSPFTGKQEAEEAANAKRIVEPDNTFREKLQTFRKISEPQPEDPVPKGPKPPLSYKTLIGNNFSQTSNSAPNDPGSNDPPSRIADHGDEDLDHDEDDDDDELDDNAPEDYHLDDLLDQDLNWELEIARRKKRWKLKEDELRDESGKKKINSL